MKVEILKTATGAVQGISAPVSAYQHSFGLFPHDNTYYDPWNKTDVRPAFKSIMERGFEAMQQKAMNTSTGGAGTASSSALVPIYIDPRVVDRSRKYTPLCELIPRISCQGLTYDYNIITAKGSAFAAAEDDSMAEVNDTYDRVSVPMKYYYSVGRITGQMQAATPSYMLEGYQPQGSGMIATNPFTNLAATSGLQLEVLNKTRSIKEFEEYLIVNGSSASDANEFDGLIIQQSTTNQLDLSSAALTWANIDRAVRMAYDDSGRPSLCIASSSVVEDMRVLVQDIYRAAPQPAGSLLPFGVPTAFQINSLVGPIVVIPSQQLSNVSGSKQAFFLDMDYMHMAVLQDLTYQDLAITNDSRKFMLKIYGSLVMRAPQFNAFIDNIA